MNTPGLPPGYPSGYERLVRLGDGRKVLIRPILPSDAEDLADAMSTADADTLRRRFLGAVPPVTPRLLDHLTTVDYVLRFALVARDASTGRGAGIARYEGHGDGTAEIAVAVDGGWRKVGVATALVRLLARAAVERGIHTFTGSYLVDNQPVAALLAGAGGTSLGADGVTELTVCLNEADVGIAADPGQDPSGTAGRPECPDD